MRRVLIVDDGAFMRKSIGDMLAQKGYDIIGEAEDGLQAIEQYEKLKPDLVTLDITMPNMDGLKALQEILKRDPDARIIMVSAIGTPDTIKRAIVTGAKGFLLKPFSADTLYTVIEDALNQP